MNKISVNKGKRRLFSVWFISCTVLFIILAIQSLNDFYDGKEKEAWEWFLPMVMPTLMLMISVYIYSPESDKNVDSMIYYAAFWGSIVYLIAVAIPLLYHPFSAKPTLEIMRLSNLWLAPVQGLVASAIGVFFVKN